MKRVCVGVVLVGFEVMSGLTTNKDQEYTYAKVNKCPCLVLGNVGKFDSYHFCDLIILILILISIIYVTSQSIVCK